MLDDRILAFCELSNDLLFGKIPQNRIDYYIDSSLALGLAAANATSGSIFDLYAKSGIEIKYNEEKGSSFGIGLRAQSTMSKDGYVVELYTQSIEELARYSDINGSKLSYEQALALHLAHEYFHFHEYQAGEFVSEKLESVIILKLFGYERKAKIGRSSEIAAHMFAKSFLQLPVLPNFFDYLYLIKIGKMSQEQFDNKIQTITKKLKVI